MKNHIKKFLFLLITLEPLMIQAADDRHQPLDPHSATVGCRGMTFYNYGPLGDLGRGAESLKKESLQFIKKQGKKSLQRLAKNPIEFEDQRSIYARQEQEKCLIIRHSHPGVTIDIEDAVAGHTGNHIKKDWLKYESAELLKDIFLEQLPPAGWKGDDLTLMPLALKKAHTLLQPNGRLVIHLALDANIRPDFTNNDLKEYRSLNPFLSVFNLSILDSLEKCIRTKPEFSKQPDHPVLKALNFYEEKITELLNGAFGPQEGKKKYAEVYTQINK